jgi:tetratricopeptide (TPR) repeat protein
VSLKRESMSVLLAIGCALGVPVAQAQDYQPNATLDRAFQTALAQYHAGKYREAAAGLETILRDLPDSFEAHELLGMVYGSESENSLANQHLEQAVRLNPRSSAARTNLATNLIRLGKFQEAEVQLTKAIALDPANFDANHNLGELYIRGGKLSDAVVPLQRAYQIDSSSYDNGYDLALAYLLSGKPEPAGKVVQDLLKTKNNAELHNLLGEIEEKDGKFVAAANEFEMAAHQEPSESNLFDWGSELLVHRTLEPAIQVFREAAERYPKSPRMAIGLGIALYSRGNYDDAIKSLLRASDLSPADPTCYFFLSRAYDSSPTQADQVIERFRRFSELQPGNARAYYYYAMSLWKGKRAQDPALDPQQIESLLRKAVTVDPKLAEAHLELGNLYSDQNHYEESIPEYVKALEGEQNLADAHYRLAQAYVHTGQKEKAQQHFEIYQQLRAQHLADLDKQIADIRQFVYSEKDTSTAKP